MIEEKKIKIGETEFPEADLKKILEEQGYTLAPTKLLEGFLQVFNDAKSENTLLKNNITQLVAGASEVAEKWKLTEIGDNPFAIAKLIPKILKKAKNMDALQEEMKPVMEPLRNIVEACKLENNLLNFKPHARLTRGTSESDGVGN